mgnify:CR=1 FL=1
MSLGVRMYSSGGSSSELRRPDNAGDLQVNHRGRTRFRPGVSGNPRGRPKGCRNKLGEEFLADLLADWQTHGVEAIARVRRERPADYLKVVASLLPKQFDLKPANPFETICDDELDGMLALLRSILADREDRRVLEKYALA